MSGIIGGAGTKSGIVGLLGAVVADGENSNVLGSYIKFESGVLVQWFREVDSANRPATTLSWEDTFFISANIQKTFPIAFVGSTGEHTVMANANSSSAYVWAVAENTGNSTGTSLILFSDRSTSTAGFYSYFAIGRWK